MLLILTNSQDITTDRLLPLLRGVPVFRFNLDAWRSYRWTFDGNGFSVRDAGGRVCTRADLRAIYYRKPMFLELIDLPAGGSPEAWSRAEVERLWQDLYEEMAVAGRALLVHPGRGQWYKPRQMRAAAKYFPVPRWWLAQGEIPPGLPPQVVAKCLTAQTLGGHKQLFVRETETARLDPAHPWFLQEKIPATHDVTVACVSGRLFAYELDRSLFSETDSRLPGLVQRMPWRRAKLAPAAQTAIRAFMKETGLDFGRLDFLRTADGKLWFLELNPNGQFAWLDPDGKEGLLRAVAGYLRKSYAALARPAGSARRKTRRGGKA